MEDKYLEESSLKSICKKRGSNSSLERGLRGLWVFWKGQHIVSQKAKWKFGVVIRTEDRKYYAVA